MNKAYNAYFFSMSLKIIVSKYNYNVPIEDFKNGHYSKITSPDYYPCKKTFFVNLKNFTTKIQNFVAKVVLKLK